jgi:hypothetical protein
MLLFAKMCGGFISGLTVLLEMLIRPGEYFQTLDDQTLLHNVLYGVAPLALAAGFLIFLANWISPAGSPEATRALLQRYGIETLPAGANVGPGPDALLFPLYWMGFAAFAGASCFGTARMLDDRKATFSLCALIAAHAALPLIVTGFLFGVLNALVPPFLHSPEFGLIRMLGTAAVVAVAWFWSLAVATTGFRVRFEQNRGRAALTWLAPWILLFVIAVYF